MSHEGHAELERNIRYNFASLEIITKEAREHHRKKNIIEIMRHYVDILNTEGPSAVDAVDLKTDTEYIVDVVRERHDIAEEALKVLIPLFSYPNDDVIYGVTKSVKQIFKATDIGIELTRQMLNPIIALCHNEQSMAHQEAVRAIKVMMNSHHEIAHEAFAKIVGFTNLSHIHDQPRAVDNIADVMKSVLSFHTSTAAMDSMIPLLTHEDWLIKMNALSIVRQIVEQRNQIAAEHVLGALRHLLADANASISEKAAKIILNIMKLHPEIAKTEVPQLISSLENLVVWINSARFPDPSINVKTASVKILTDAIEAKLPIMRVVGPQLFKTLQSYISTASAIHEQLALRVCSFLAPLFATQSILDSLLTEPALEQEDVSVFEPAGVVDDTEEEDDSWEDVSDDDDDSDEVLDDAEIEALVEQDYAREACSKGLKLVKAGRAEEAIKEYDFVISVVPKDPHAYFYKGAALYALNRIEESNAEYRKFFNTLCEFSNGNELNIAISMHSFIECYSEMGDLNNAYKYTMGVIDILEKRSVRDDKMEAKLAELLQIKLQIQERMQNAPSTSDCTSKADDVTSVAAGSTEDPAITEQDATMSNEAKIEQQRAQHGEEQAVQQAAPLEIMKIFPDLPQNLTLVQLGGRLSCLVRNEKKQELEDYIDNILSQNKLEELPYAAVVMISLRRIYRNPDYDEKYNTLQGKLYEIRNEESKAMGARILDPNFTPEKSAVESALARCEQEEWHKKHYEITQEAWDRQYQEICKDLSHGKLWTKYSVEDFNKEEEISLEELNQITLPQLAQGQHITAQHLELLAITANKLKVFYEKISSLPEWDNLVGSKNDIKGLFKEMFKLVSIFECESVVEGGVDEYFAYLAMEGQVSSEIDSTGGPLARKIQEMVNNIGKIQELLLPGSTTKVHQDHHQDNSSASDNAVPSMGDNLSDQDF